MTRRWTPNIEFPKNSSMVSGHGIRPGAAVRLVEKRTAPTRALAWLLNGDFNGTVSASAARKHLHELSKAGVGRRSVERITGISSVVLCAIKSGAKTRIRARTEKLILSVTEMYSRGPVPGDLGYCEPCWKGKKHLCFASSKVDGIAKCDGCAKGMHCNWHLGSGYRGNGSKGRPADLPSVAKLARKHPHGHKMRWLGGCRCWKCRRGNRKYEDEIRSRRELFGPNDLVSTDKVKNHLHWLQGFGIGCQTVSRVTGVGKTGLSEILWYGKKLMRRRAASAVLSVTPSLETYPKCKMIPASETLAKLRQLIEWGIPRVFINRDGLSNISAELQILSLKGNSPVVTVRTALAVRDYFSRVEKMREIWFSLGRAIPPEHYVYWKRNRHGMTVRSFELLQFPVTYDYANLYSKELKDAIRAKNQLIKALRHRRINGRKQDVGPARPSIRDAASAEG